MKKILLIEDAPEYQFIVTSVLSNDYEVSVASTLQEGNHFLESKSFDLILIDVILPDGDGFHFCAEFKKQKDKRETPVIFTTIKSGLTEKLFGFSLGADDYIVKPYEALELKARVDAKIKRPILKESLNEALKKGDLSLNFLTLNATFLDDGTEFTIELTPIEFKILSLFMKNEGLVLSRETIVEAAWGTGSQVFDRAADKHISSLRSKLKRKSKYISTRSGMGYLFSTKSE